MSKNIRVRTIQQSPEGIADMVAGIRRFMADKVNEVLQREIDKGNDIYTAEIDNKPINNRQGIYFAKKSIRISFQSPAMEIALDRAVSILRRQVQEYFVNQLGNKLDPTKYKANPEWVHAWLCEKGNASIEITDYKNARLNANQYFAVTVEIPSGQLNPIPVGNWLSTRKHNKGFYFRAAQNIRSALRVSRRGGSVRVAAVRGTSPRTYQPLEREKQNGMNWKTLKAHTHIPRTIAETTNWMIIIELRGNHRGQVLRG